MDTAGAVAGTLHLSMFERVVISVVAAAMLWVGVQVTTNAIAIARIEERTSIIGLEISSLRRKVDQNILPLADARLTRVEREVLEIGKSIDKLESIILRLDDNSHP